LYQINFSNISNKKRFIRLLILIYLVITVLIFSTSIILAKSETSKTVGNDLKTILKNTKTQLELTAKINSIDAKNLAVSNAIRFPLMLGISNQVKEQCQKLIESDYSNLENIIAIDSNGKTIYSNIGIFQENLPSDLSLKRYSYMSYHKGEGIYLLYYYPIVYDNRFYGALVYVCDLSDFSDIILDQIKNTPYQFYGITDKKVAFITNAGKLKKVNYALDSEFTGKMLKKSLSLEIGNVGNKLSFETLSDDKGAFDDVISLGISDRAYSQIQLKNIFIYMAASTGLLVLFALVTILVLLLTRTYTYKSTQSKMQIQNLRAQKHDFMKHLNVINGLINYDEYDSLKTYINELSVKITLQNEIGKSGNPAIGVLMQQKGKQASDSQIPFSFICDIRLSDISIGDSAMCTILGNLIDNAIEASLEVPLEMRGIEIEITSKSDLLLIKVSNKGNPIKPSSIDKIFKQGYTTKKDKVNHGMGLHTICKLLKKYDGGIEVENFNGSVCFTVYLP